MLHNLFQNRKCINYEKNKVMQFIIHLLLVCSSINQLHKQITNFHKTHLLASIITQIKMYPPATQRYANGTL